MTPPPSNPPPVHKSSHSRNSSANPVPKPEPKASKRQPTEPAVHYTALIRLPFPRGNFVDPPSVEWDASKDKALWKIISRSSRTSDLNWEELAVKFGVSPTFMLQQAAWLYERHLSHVRAQMRKVGSSNAPSPAPPTGSVSASAAGTSGKMPSGGGGSRAPSALSVRPREDSLPSKGDAGQPGTTKPGASLLSRTPSTATLTQSRPVLPSSPSQPAARSFRDSLGGERPPRKTESPLPAPPEGPPEPSSRSSPAESSSSSSSSDSEPAPEPVRRSQIFKRPPRLNVQKSPLSRVDDGDADDDDEDAFLPFARPASRTTAPQDPSATIRETVEQPKLGSTRSRTASTPVGRQAAAVGKQPAPRPAAVESSATSASSASSAAPQNEAPRSSARPPGPLSPRHRAELARLSPRHRGKGKDGSDGTPSMGSSFSDLDDASVTQSALEEALLSNMQNGAMSRISTLSSLKSKYL